MAKLINQPIHIASAIQNLQQSSFGKISQQSCDSSPKTKIEPRIEKLFVCFAAAMHLKFTAAFPTSEAIVVGKLVWQRGLADLKDGEIKAGIDALADWKDDRFPTLNEFKILLCTRERPERKCLTHDNDYKPADVAVVKNCWEKAATTATGPLKIAINKILKRYEEKQ